MNVLIYNKRENYKDIEHRVYLNKSKQDILWDIQSAISDAKFVEVFNIKFCVSDLFDGNKIKFRILKEGKEYD